jgi:hypothetical protein
MCEEPTPASVASRARLLYWRSCVPKLGEAARNAVAGQLPPLPIEQRCVAYAYQHISLALCEISLRQI